VIRGIVERKSVSRKQKASQENSGHDIRNEGVRCSNHRCGTNLFNELCENHKPKNSKKITPGNRKGNKQRIFPDNATDNIREISLRPHYQSQESQWATRKHTTARHVLA
jgi:hypothetical protein